MTFRGQTAEEPKKKTKKRAKELGGVIKEKEMVKC
jgi:hypothetical protein